jgi:hypothetical protein
LSQVPSPRDTRGCKALTQRLDDQNESFAARLRAIRSTHLRLRDYDGLTISALDDRSLELRKFLFALRETDDNFEGCSGPPLAGLRRLATERLLEINNYRNVFQRFSAR